MFKKLKYGYSYTPYQTSGKIFIDEKSAQAYINKLNKTGNQIYINKFQIEKVERATKIYKTIYVKPESESVLN